MGQVSLMDEKEMENRLSFFLSDMKILGILTTSFNKLEKTKVSSLTHVGRRGGPVKH